MPLIHVDLMAGRTPQQHAALIRGLTDAAVAALGSDPDTVRVVIHEMTPQTYGVGGETFEVVAERRDTELVAERRDTELVEERRHTEALGGPA